MRLAFGQILILLVILAVIAAIIAGAIFGIIKLVKYAKRRETDRKEMLDLMREQNRHGGE